MRPLIELFPDILKEIPNSSVHPICMETIDPIADMHGRRFSSPYSGTVEDSVTGTDSGAMRAYFTKCILRFPFENPLEIVVEQGQEIHKDGRVRVEVLKNEKSYNIQIIGNAIHINDFKVYLKDN